MVTWTPSAPTWFQKTYSHLASFMLSHMFSLDFDIFPFALFWWPNHLSLCLLCLYFLFCLYLPISCTHETQNGGFVGQVVRGTTNILFFRGQCSLRGQSQEPLLLFLKSTSVLLFILPLVSFKLLNIQFKSTCHLLQDYHIHYCYIFKGCKKYQRSVLSGDHGTTRWTLMIIIFSVIESFSSLEDTWALHGLRGK